MFKFTRRPMQANGDPVINDGKKREVDPEKKKQENARYIAKRKEEWEKLQQQVADKDLEILRLNNQNQSLRDQMAALNTSLMHKHQEIQFLNSLNIQPDNDKTVECYQQIDSSQAFKESCVSDHVNDTETKRFLKAANHVDFSKVPKVVQDKRKIIFVGMAGSCRHKPMLSSMFKDYRIIFNDASQPMLDYGKRNYKINDKDLDCSRVQDFDFNQFKNKMSLCVCWWNACYLGLDDLKTYLKGMLMALKCNDTSNKFGTSVSHDGYIIMAEPVGPASEKNEYGGQSMAIKPPGYYETIFRELDIEIIAESSYSAYPADQDTTINAQKVWVLREDPSSAKNSANQQRLFVPVKNSNGKYSMKWTVHRTKTVQKKSTSIGISKAPSKKESIVDKRKDRIEKGKNKEQGQKKIDFEETEVTTKIQQQLTGFFASINSLSIDIKSPKSITSDVNDSDNDQDMGLNQDFKNKLTLNDKKY